MKVRDIMTTSVVSAHRTEPVSSIVMKMVTRHTGAIPIINEERKLIGIISLRDILMPIYPDYIEFMEDNVRSRNFVDMEDRYWEVMEKRAEDVMTHNPTSVSPSDPVLKCASEMGLKNLRRIPVTDENNVLVGMVSIGDINRGLFFSAAAEKKLKERKVANM